MRKFLTTITAVAIFATSLTLVADAEEGMWTFDNIPLKELTAKYNFTPTQEWLDNVRLSSVRFNDGGSGSFISATGLVLTNHHVAVGQLQKMSSEQKDYVKDGYYADSYEKEVKCSDLELNVLVDMKDVTESVEKSFKGLKGEEAIKARKAAIAEIEKKNLEKTGLRSNVVSLYQGGEYWLYTYKQYRDVRLVFAPEKQIAFFGGDSDNFTYPRYDLDFAIFRVYENDKPIVAKNFMKINPLGAKPDELVFITGHPGTTKRSITFAEYLFNRDYTYPNRLNGIKTALDTLRKYSATGQEQARRASTTIFYLENSEKALSSEYVGLKNPEFTSLFEKKENDLKNKINEKKELKETGKAFVDIAQAKKLHATRYNEIMYGVMSLSGSYSELLPIAQDIVLYVIETAKPDGERIDGYHDSDLDAWKYKQLSPAPIYKDMDEVLLANYFENSVKKLGQNHKIVKLMLSGKSPNERAKELVSGTKLQDAAYRKSLIEGGMEALKKSDDPMIKLALAMDSDYRELYKWFEKNVESITTPASEKIANAKFKVYGKNVYPDATFTLRLTYGTVKGYPMNGTVAPCFTTFYGLFDRAYSFELKGDWNLPESYLKNKNKIKMETPLNFVSTCDITGGNSGSPVINAKGEVVGLVFDGNIESLPGRFIYDETANRAVSVQTSGIIESLRSVYNTGKLLKEIL